MIHPFDLVMVSGGLSAVVVTTRALWILTGRLGAPKASPPPRELAEVAERLTEIERSTEAIVLEIERLAEAQRFTARLLAERPPASAARLDAGRQPGREGRVNTPH